MSAEPPEDEQADTPAPAPDEEAQSEVQAADTTAKAEAKAARKPARKRKAAKAREDAQEAGGSSEATAEPAASEPAAPAKRAARKPSAAKKARAAKKAAPVEKPPAEEPAEAAAEPVAERRATPTPRAAGAGAKRAPRRNVVRAHARYVRTSARKARMVCGHLRGKSVEEARAILAFTPREVARDWSKLLESAVANAETNHELLQDDLIVQEAYADEGPTIKRFRPRAMGRATPIAKRTTHLTITLTPGTERPTNKRHG
jgi:large subunit ribosomal protein L22